jgi:hypothetical protein
MDVPPEDSQDAKHLEQIFSALSARVNTEISTYWARSNLLLALNVGLLALGFNQERNGLTPALLALFGITTTCLWLLIATRGRAWLRFWENRLINVEKLFPQPSMYPDYWFDDLKEAIKQGRPKPVTNLILLVPFIVILAWFLLLWRWYFAS